MLVPPEPFGRGEAGLQPHAELALAMAAAAAGHSNSLHDPDLVASRVVTTFFSCGSTHVNRESRTAALKRLGCLRSAALRTNLRLERSFAHASPDPLGRTDCRSAILLEVAETRVLEVGVSGIAANGSDRVVDARKARSQSKSCRSKEYNDER